jgi:hypothetical protein
LGFNSACEHPAPWQINPDPHWTCCALTSDVTRNPSNVAPIILEEYQFAQALERTVADLPATLRRGTILVRIQNSPTHRRKTPRLPTRMWPAKDSEGAAALRRFSDCVADDRAQQQCAAITLNTHRELGSSSSILFGGTEVCEGAGPLSSTCTFLSAPLRQVPRCLQRSAPLADHAIRKNSPSRGQPRVRFHECRGPLRNAEFCPRRFGMPVTWHAVWEVRRGPASVRE